MKTKAIFSVFIITLLSVANAYAQIGLPCAGDDPDTPCPLDTWVIVLVVAASMFAAFRLYRRQASLQGSR